MAVASCGCVYAQQMTELTKAMFSAYDQTLKEDPEDYITYYRRAVEYYRASMYPQALDDINSALKFCPAKDFDLLMHIYSLQADVFIQQDKLDDALKAIDKALAINPKSYADVYKRGNVCLALKDAEGARKAFQSLLQFKTRSQEAFYGLAQVAAMQGNLEEAISLLDELKNADATSPLTFVRIGDVYRDMGQYEKAVVNYLTSIALGHDLGRPLQELEEIATKDYAAFTSGYNYALSQAGQARPTLSYIQGVIAANTGHLQDAFDIYSAIAADGQEQTPSFLTRAADVAMRLNKLSQARGYLDQALQERAFTDACRIKSQLELAENSPAQALIYANKAYSPAAPTVPDLLAVASANIALGNATDANAALNEALLLDAENVRALLLRAYVKEYMLNDKNGARADLERAGNAPAETFPEIAYKAIGQTLSGKMLDGEATISKALEADQSPLALASAAVYYAQTGLPDKATEYVDKARDAGFEDVYFLELDKTPYLSLSTRK